MLALQIKILSTPFVSIIPSPFVSIIKTICFHHEEELLKKFSLQQRNCSDPFNINPNKQRTK